MSRVQKITVKEEEEDQRLDRWLKKKFPNLKQPHIEKICRKGDLRLDGRRVKASTRIETGQVVRIPPINENENIRPKNSKQVISDSDAKMLMGSVLYKDEHLIVINKPPGLPVQGGTGQLKHLDGMSEVLKFGYPDKPRLVHRLDKDTSGVLLLARSAQAAKYLTAAFRHRETRKIYWAAVAGVPAIKTGTIKYGLVKMKGHGPDGMGEKMKCLHPDEVAQIDNAKRATTDYTIIDNAGQRVAWLALVPITGRTHQLRAHVAELGHPIVGDGKYGTNSQINEGDGWGSQLGGEISRKLHLHSKSLSFVHPFTKKMVNFSAPLPEHMLRTWDFLDWTPKEADLDPFLSDEKKI